MTEWLHLVGYALIACGAGFFVAGNLGLIRFPDLYARLHALTKADNLGLGLICLGLACQAASLAAAVKILLVWALMLVASSVGATLIASTALACGIRPREGAQAPGQESGGEEPRT
ncbi:monovalent cation/H(+) antiporter subunit G [Halomonas mongoliensis]|uniref:Monovalent cation/H(+) antiporter subunit G n=1 Tax=Halomonas mongoliensis TaxID=321265 RepID=A0ABU1GMC1_9GAMM|nr:monovalent cation/H(+) antiporter subunit G [Halomonas mongoliensis]MDR5892697.1 monovalent cation/H(+) antiporter subunit G [Halomonas mongoliensis]